MISDEETCFLTRNKHKTPYYFASSATRFRKPMGDEMVLLTI